MNEKSEDFFQKVWNIVLQIPYGKVTTYGAIAKCLGTKSSSRVVGYAMNASHHAKTDIPAHRVVNRNGMLTGKHHFGSPNLMQELLENEGIAVENDKIVDFQKHFWNPEDSLCF